MLLMEAAVAEAEARRQSADHRQASHRQAGRHPSADHRGIHPRADLRENHHPWADRRRLSHSVDHHGSRPAASYFERRGH